MATPSARLLTLLSLLQARRDWPGRALAARLDVSERTVRRDVEHLRELGYRITPIKGPAGGYRLDPGADLPPLLFDDDQAVALAVALRAAAASGARVGEAAERALASVRQVLPDRLRRRIDALDGAAVSPAPAGAPAADPGVLVAVSEAIRAREVLRFDEVGREDAAVPRRIEPFQLLLRGGRWYVVGWDPDRADWRVRRVDRIVPRGHRGGRFLPRDLPGGDVAAYVEGVFRGAGGPGDWPCRGSAVLRVDAAAILPYRSDAVIEQAGEGCARVTAGSWSWTALAVRLLGYDVEPVSAEPAELRVAFAEVAGRAAAIGRAAGGAPDRAAVDRPVGGGRA